MGSTSIDMTGWKMSEHGVPESRWEVLYQQPFKNNGQLVWHCRCSCSEHTEKDIPGGELRRGKTKSCGCLRKDKGKQNAKNELIGKKFGQLTIIEDSGKRASDGSIMWRCSCDCGNNDYLIATSELNRTGARAKTHCNNSWHNINDLTGKTFGDLEVIEIDKSSIGSGKIRWWCKCYRCNREDLTNHLGNSLLLGKSQTCGCGHSTSRGAEKIQNILQSANLTIKQEYSFNDLVNPKTNSKLRFDFGIEENGILKCLIEYDGEQHFKFQPNNISTWNTEDHFKETIYRDTLKNEYCIKHNILLYRIPYYDIDKINSYEDILQNKYLIKE